MLAWRVMRHANDASFSAAALKAPPLCSYEDYDFGRETNVVDIGVQPLWLPACVISAAMQHDRVLQQTLQELGMTARFHPFMKGADVNTWLLNGHLEVGIGGDMPTLSAASKTNIVVATLIQQGFCSIISGHPMLMADLRGKRIGYAFGSNAHFALLNALAEADIQEEQVKLVSMDVQIMPDMLARGVIDAFAAWEPTPSIALKTVEGSSAVQRCLTTGYMYFSGAFAKENPKTMRAIIASQVRAMHWMKADGRNLEKACGWALNGYEALSGEKSPLTRAEYADISRSDLLGRTMTPIPPAANLIDGAPLHKEYQFLHRQGRVSTLRMWDDVKACFENTTTEQLVKSSSSYRLNEWDFD
jgi:sulfonate transport system substrate-binding protein